MASDQDGGLNLDTARTTGGDEDAPLLLDETPTQGGAPAGAETIARAPYDPSRDRERKRGQIAMYLIALLFFVCLVPYVFVLAEILCLQGGGTAPMCSKFGAGNLEKLTQLFLTPIVGLVGAVTGFYYGENAR